MAYGTALTLLLPLGRMPSACSNALTPDWYIARLTNRCQTQETILLDTYLILDPSSTVWIWYVRKVRLGTTNRFEMNAMLWPTISKSTSVLYYWHQHPHRWEPEDLTISFSDGGTSPFRYTYDAQEGTISKLKDLESVQSAPTDPQLYNFMRKQSKEEMNIDSIRYFAILIL